MTVSFFVPGVPRPKGSLDPRRRNGKMYVRPNNAHLLGPWQAMVGFGARAAGVKCTKGPIRLVCEFVLQRPGTHFIGGDGERLKATAPVHHIQTPDADKLRRAVMDALSKVAWVDDKQVVDPRSPKRWAKPGERGGVHIEIEVLEGGNP